MSGCCLVNRAYTPFPAAHHSGDPAVWTADDGTKFPYLKVTPSKGQKRRGLVVLANGWDSSTEDYRPLAERLAQHGYVVMGSEIRGQKYDPNIFRRGLPGSYRDWVKDLEAFSRFARHEYPGLPWFIHAHSFGGLVGLAAIGDSHFVEKPRGVIVHSPGFPFIVQKENRLVGVLLAPFFWVRIPHLLLAEINDTKPMNDPVKDGVWLRSPDRLRCGYTLRFFSECVKLGQAANAALEGRTVPLLALEGGKDRVVTNGDQVARPLYTDFMKNRVGRTPNEYRRYPTEGHTVFVGGEGERALSDILAWLDRHR